MNNIKKFNNFDESNKDMNEKIDLDKDLSKDEIISQRSEIANKISEIENSLEAEEVTNVEEIELELESLKKEYSVFQLLAESKVFTHKSIIKK